MRILPVSTNTDNFLILNNVNKLKINNLNFICQIGTGLI